VLALPALVPIAVMIFAPGLGHRLVRSRSHGGQPESRREPAVVPDRELRADPAVGPEVAVAVV
jgi:hypothetical protein